ncbi:unnamed protein product [Blepharisma stoltei]|uniref:Uncharacterized protein n=1 Tax=Blepharisma stoltei TaxID=1481888 RepID=A0AAU9J685_9CILI|nr:unnamed protein product [Blepharisma stoltei]
MEFLKTDFKNWIVKKCENSMQGVSLNFYELIHTPHGFDALQSWFLTMGGSELDEYAFFKLMKLVVNEMTEPEAWETFDTLCQEPTITLKEFLMLVFLYASLETKQMKVMLYMHGKMLYQLLAGSERHEISFERVKRIGRLIKLNERYLIQKGRELGISWPMKSSLTFEQFQLFYFDIFSELDYTEVVQQQEPKPEPVVVVSAAKPPLPVAVKKRTTKCASCQSKHCMLL